MPTHPRGPRMYKGALVTVAAFGMRPAVIVFQYNPETLRRGLDPQTQGAEGGRRSEGVRFRGAPVETIDVEILIDATDQLEAGDSTALSKGIFPQLSALETLLYPGSAQVIANTALLNTGTIEIAPYAAPLTLFIWGQNRVLPVTLTSFSIDEETFDTQLNPIRASVTLGLRALSYSDVDQSNKAYHLFLTYQANKEALAMQNTAGAVRALLGSLPNF